MLRIRRIYDNVLPVNKSTLEQVQEEARKHVAGYKVPRELHIVPEVPRAPSGKPASPKAKDLALSGDYKVA